MLKHERCVALLLTDNCILSLSCGTEDDKNVHVNDVMLMKSDEIMKIIGQLLLTA